MMSNWKTLLAILAVSFVAACANKAKNTEPDDMSVEEHQAAAAEHEAKSDDHAEQYDPDAEAQRQESSPPTRPNEGAGVYKTEVYNPTARHEELAERHKKHAQQHQAAAQTLLEFEEKHCAKFPEETRAACPLMGQVTSAENVDGGVEMNFRKDVNFKAMSDHIHCHFAFARSEGYEGMATCPLYVKGIEISRDAEARTVTITNEGEEAVRKVRERAKAHVTQTK